LKEDVAIKRQAFFTKIADSEPKNLIFLDESGAKPDINRRYARSQRGFRIHDHTPGSWGKPITMIAAIGVGTGIIAPWTMRGAMNTRTFLQWLRRHLLPALKDPTTIVMDNLRVHHVTAVQDVIEDAGHTVVFLPPYSPDLNPIEMCWSKTKADLRRRRPKTARSLQTQFHRSIRTVTESDIAAYFRHTRIFPRDYRLLDDRPAL
jgi:transposase